MNPTELNAASEQAFRHVLRSDSWGAVDYYCLGVHPMTAVGPSNPPSDLLHRLSGVRPRVVRASSCEVTDRGVQHRTTRSPAQLFVIDAADWRGRDEALVVIRSYVNRLNSRSQRCTVTRGEDGTWRVDRCATRMGP